MRRLTVLGSVAALMLAVGFTVASGVDDSDLPHRVYAPLISAGDAAPQPTATPSPPASGAAVLTLYLESGGVTNNPVVEPRHTEQRLNGAQLQTPTHPSRVAWYNRFGHPGFAQNNTMLSAHVDYVGYGDGPFHDLIATEIGSALYLRLEDGTEYAYTVKSVEVINLDVLDMNEVVYPDLDEHTERVTLITCGGTFVPYPGGGGAYNSRVILVAERWVP